MVTSFLFGWPIFRGELLALGRVTKLKLRWMEMDCEGRDCHPKKMAMNIESQTSDFFDCNCNPKKTKKCPNRVTNPGVLLNRWDSFHGNLRVPTPPMPRFPQEITGHIRRLLRDNDG